MLKKLENLLKSEIDPVFAKRAEFIFEEVENIKKSSIYSTGYKNNYFDFIICSEVLEHLHNDGKALIELKRILKPGGIVVITVPNYKFPFLWDPLNWILMRFFHTHIPKNIWWLAGIWADHERLYDISDLVKKIQNTGLTVIKKQSIISFSWPFSHFILYGTGKNIVERLNMKTFTRFEFKKNYFKMLLAKIFSLPSKLQIVKSAVDIVIV